MPIIELSWNNHLGIALAQWAICCYELPKPPRDSFTFKVLSYSSIILLLWRLSIPLPSMFLPGDSHEDSNGASSSSFFILFLLRWFQLKPFNSTGAISPLIFSTVFLWVGPNPQVFPRILPDFSYSPGVSLKFISKFDVRMILHQSNAFSEIFHTIFIVGSTSSFWFFQSV